jgi:hypothetical protein
MDFLISDQAQRVLEILKIVALVGGLAATIRLCWGGVTSGLALTRKRELAGLRKRRDLLVRLHESDRAYYGWLLSGILWALVVLGVQLMFEGSMGTPFYELPQERQLADVIRHVGRFGAGMIVYAIALHRVVRYRWLQRFDRTIATLDRKIATLEAKMSLQTASAGI